MIYYYNLPLTDDINNYNDFIKSIIMYSALCCTTHFYSLSNLFLNHTKTITKRLLLAFTVFALLNNIFKENQVFSCRSYVSFCLFSISSRHFIEFILFFQFLCVYQFNCITYFELNRYWNKYSYEYESTVPSL